MFRFHYKTAEILPKEPSVMPNAGQLLDQAEQRLGVSLPAAVREWYSLKNAYSILRTYSNDDPPIDLSEFGGKINVSDSRLVFKHENQGVCTWAVRIDGSEDPPVDVTYDDEVWESGAETFSDYIFSCVWDNLFVLNHEPLIQAQNDPLSEGALDWLQIQFPSVLTTHGWPGHSQYRFESKDRHLLIWASRGQADWWLSARTMEGAMSLMAAVWKIDDVGKAFWSNSEEGDEVIAKVRRAIATGTISPSTY